MASGFVPLAACVGRGVRAVARVAAEACRRGGAGKGTSAELRSRRLVEHPQRALQALRTCSGNLHLARAGEFSAQRFEDVVYHHCPEVSFMTCRIDETLRATARSASSAAWSPAVSGWQARAEGCLPEADLKPASSHVLPARDVDLGAVRVDDPVPVSGASMLVGDLIGRAEPMRRDIVLDDLLGAGGEDRGVDLAGREALTRMPWRPKSSPSPG